MIACLLGAAPFGSLLCGLVSHLVSLYPRCGLLHARVFTLHSFCKPFQQNQAGDIRR